MDSRELDQRPIDSSNDLRRGRRVLATDAWELEQSTEVDAKALQRAEVTKRARLLQSRLALASFKAKRGWASLDRDTAEPKNDREFDDTRHRKRSRGNLAADLANDDPFSAKENNNMVPVSSSNSVSDDLFSDDMPAALGGANRHWRPPWMSSFDMPGSAFGPSLPKRARANSLAAPSLPTPHSEKKVGGNISQSSPVYHRKHPHFPVSHGANLSFISEAATIPIDPPSPTETNSSSEEDDDLPLYSFQVQPPKRVRHSSPHTPLNRTRSAPHHQHKRAGSSSVRQSRQTGGEEGADLLMYLANSPSAADPSTDSRAVHLPSTPPSRSTVLTSTLMTTPRGSNFLAGFAAPNTPAQPFNIADWMNFTPSPAQVPWVSRSPTMTRTARGGGVKTPPAAQEARRVLYPDGRGDILGSSPNLNSPESGGVDSGRRTGLGMELGGELLS